MSFDLTTTYNALELSESDKFVERHAERTIARLICADSTTHAIKMRNFPDVLIIKDEQGQKKVEIKARAICDTRTIRAFLALKGLQNLTIASYRVDSLADEYAKYLRTDYQKKNKSSLYQLIKQHDDLLWLKTICTFAIAEYIAWNKREQEAFIDDRAATLTDMGYFLRKVRGHVHEAPNRIKKYHISETDEIEHVTDTMQAKIAEIVEDLADRDLPGYGLDPLPVGVPIPLSLPMGEKKEKAND